MIKYVDFLNIVFILMDIALFPVKGEFVGKFLR
jgi:hypothetical protein